MALIRCDFFSEVLQLSTSMTVILPQRTAGQVGMTGGAHDGAPPVLYLLHGISDDATTWLRRTSIERYVEPLGLAVVMPQVERSFYCDEVHGNRYWTFLSEELPALVGEFFQVSDRREDTYVAGLSMGGYGAFKWALRQPHRFTAAASLSGSLDIVRQTPPDHPLLRTIFGGRPAVGTDSDLLWLLDQVDPGALPRLYACCGTEDPLLGENVTFRDACQERGLPLTTDFGAGHHEWGYWDAKIQEALAWFGIGSAGVSIRDATHST